MCIRDSIYLSQPQKKFIQQIKAEGCGRVKEVVQDYKGLSSVDNEMLEDYLEKKISYDLDEAATDGLVHFRNLCHQHGMILKKHSIEFL